MAPRTTTQWGVVLRRLRTEKRLTLHQLAKRTSVSSHDLGRYEDGEAFPSRLELAKLYGTLPALRHSVDLLPPSVRKAAAVAEAMEAMAAEEEQRKEAVVEVIEKETAAEVIEKETAAAVEASPEAAPAREGKAKMLAIPAVEERRRVFGAALKAAREKEGVTPYALAKTIDVSTGQVYDWERGKASPLGEGYGKLLAVLPDLAAAPPPLTRWGRVVEPIMPGATPAPASPGAPPPAPTPSEPEAGGLEAAGLRFAKATTRAADATARAQDLRRQADEAMAAAAAAESACAEALHEEEEAKADLLRLAAPRLKFTA